MTRIIKTSISITMLTITLFAFSDAQAGEKYRSLRLSGPRMGMSYAIPDGGKLQQRLEKHGMGQTISQFGWHFEWVVEPETKGPAFIIEAIPLFGGVEYGLLIPSASLLMGIRLPSGFEFGMGPMAYFNGDTTVPIGSSLVMAVGKSLDFNSVNIPLNLAVATNPEGTRVSFVFGYALTQE